MMSKVWIHRSYEHSDYYYDSKEAAIEAAKRAAESCGCSMRHIYVYELVAEVDGTEGARQHPVTIKEFA